MKNERRTEKAQRAVRMAITALAVGGAAIVAAVAPAYAQGPLGETKASPSGQLHGAFNQHNSVYGEPGTPGGVSDSLNSSGFGTNGGAPGSHDGAVGQEPGATGYNNSEGAPFNDLNGVGH